MDVEPKEALEWLGLAAGAGCFYAWVRNLGGRLRKVEKRLEDEHGEPLLVSYAAHDIKCGVATGALLAEMQHLTGSINALTEVVEGQTKEFSELSKQVAVLDERSKRRRAGDDGE